jgi:hypothetical protein
MGGCFTSGLAVFWDCWCRRRRVLSRRAAPKDECSETVSATESIDPRSMLATNAFPKKTKVLLPELLRCIVHEVCQKSLGSSVDLINNGPHPCN